MPRACSVLVSAVGEYGLHLACSICLLAGWRVLWVCGVQGMVGKGGGMPVPCNSLTLIGLVVGQSV